MFSDIDGNLLAGEAKIMENAVLCLIMILLFVFGYFVMDRLGRCMSMLYRHAEDLDHRAGRAGIIFTEEKSPA